MQMNFRLKGTRVSTTFQKASSTEMEEECKQLYVIYLIFPAVLGSGVYSASNRIEYQKHKNNVSGGNSGWCIGLTNLPPSVSRLSRQCEILNISQPYRPPRPVTGIALLYGDGVCSL
jgi:hypothetical protein